MILITARQITLLSIPIYNIIPSKTFDTNNHNTPKLILEICQSPNTRPYNTNNIYNVIISIPMLNY